MSHLDHSYKKGKKRPKPQKRKIEAASKPKKNPPAKKVSAPKKDAVATRDTSGRFIKGVSGNPGGPWKVAATLEIREAARTYGPESIERLAFWMRSADPQSSIMAAKILLERGYGKAIQPLTGTPNGAPLVSLTIGAAPVASAEEAARVYAELCRDPSLDVSGLKFASRREPALIEQGSNTKDIADGK
jgi:hypothetical protein